MNPSKTVRLDRQRRLVRTEVTHLILGDYAEVVIP